MKATDFPLDTELVLLFLSVRFLPFCGFWTLPPLNRVSIFFIFIDEFEEIVVSGFRILNLPNSCQTASARSGEAKIAAVAPSEAKLVVELPLAIGIDAIAIVTALLRCSDMRSIIVKLLLFLAQLCLTHYFWCGANIYYLNTDMWLTDGSKLVTSATARPFVRSA